MQFISFRPLFIISIYLDVCHLRNGIVYIMLFTNKSNESLVFLYIDLIKKVYFSINETGMVLFWGGHHR